MTKWLRFRDLRERQIVDSWAQLANLIRDQGFPPGRMFGPNTRVWDEDNEIEPWLKNRPVVGPAPRGVAKARRGRPSRAERAARKAEREAERAALEAAPAAADKQPAAASRKARDEAETLVSP